MRAKTVNEAIDFERGVDPKKIMGIGIRGALADGLIRLYKDFSGMVGYTNAAGSVGISLPSDIAESESEAYATFAKYIPEIAIESLRKDWRGKWEIWINRKYNDDLQYAYREKERLSESLDFERGIDPKEALNIGREELRLVAKLDRLARKYGFEKTPFSRNDEEKGIRNIQKWFHPKYETEIILYIDEEWEAGGYCINYEDLAGSGNDSVEQWLDPEVWEYHYGGDPEEEEPEESEEDDEEYDIWSE